MERLKQCYICKEKFRKSELTEYASYNSQTFHSYCPKCLIEKQSRDNFSQKVCEIFGLKTPGPRIWTERKRLIEKYGYTDDIIVDCLDYIYTVVKKKKLSESLYLVNPVTVNEMKKYKEYNKVKAFQLASATNMKTAEYIVPVKEKYISMENWDPDDWLEEGI